MSRAPLLIRETRVGSTLDVLHRLAQDGAAAGTAVVAEEQMTGRGARGRQWHSPPGGLWLSVLYRPEGAVVPEVLAIRLALAVAQTVEEAAGVDGIAIKWPNDLMLDDRKLGGVLCELRWHGSTLAWIATGVGLNVANPLPLEVRETAARLHDRRAGIAPGQLVVPVVDALRRLPVDQPVLSELELAHWARRDWLLGRRLAQPVNGIGGGVGPDGALRVRSTGGATISARSGHVVLAEADA